MVDQNRDDSDRVGADRTPLEPTARHHRGVALAILVMVAAVLGGVLWSNRGSLSATDARVVAAPRAVTLPGSGVPSPVALASSAVADMNGTNATDRTDPSHPSDPSHPVRPADGAPRVHVVGAIRRGGVYALPPKARVIDAIRQAGGARADADLEAVNLADFVRDGEQIRVPTKRETARATTATPATVVRMPASEPRPSSRRPSPGQRSAPSLSTAARTLGRYPSAARELSARADHTDGIININTAGVEELDSLPGVGPAIAERIIAYRKEYGPFQRPEDLLQVRGIGEKTLAKLLDRVAVR